MSMFGRCVLIGALFSGVLHCPSGGSDNPTEDLDKLLQSEGFTPLTPPSEGAGPGAIVVAAASGSPTVVCTAAQSLGASYVPEKSPTASITSQATTGGSVSLSASSLLSDISAGVDLTSVQEIDASLENAFVVSASEADIVDNSGNRAPGCTTAVGAQAAGTTLSYITEVYQADCTLTVKFKTGISGDVQAQITSDIAVQLGGSWQVSGSGAISGQALYWGFRSQPM